MEEVAIICIRVAKIICIIISLYEAWRKQGLVCLPGSQDKPQMEMNVKYKVKWVILS